MFYVKFVYLCYFMYWSRKTISIFHLILSNFCWMFHSKFHMITRTLDFLRMWTKGTFINDVTQRGMRLRASPTLFGRHFNQMEYPMYISIWTLSLNDIESYPKKNRTPHWHIFMWHHLSYNLKNVFMIDFTFLKFRQDSESVELLMLW